MGAYRHWLDTLEAMANFRRCMVTPTMSGIRLDKHEDLFDGFAFRDGWMPFPLVAIVEGGVRFPIQPLLGICLSTWHLSPCQLMSNGYKIIMSAIELNRILGINLGVHDIEDPYDDSSRHAGDDRLYVFGNWEFGENEIAAEMRYMILHFGIPPKIRQRRREARLSEWRQNNDWQRVVRNYKGHNTRAAWSLLGYEPKYRNYIKRKSDEPADAPADLERLRASGAEASSLCAEPEADLQQVVEAYTSSSSEEGIEKRRLALQTKTLGDKFFGKRAPISPSPPFADPNPASMASGAVGAFSAAGASVLVRQRPAETRREGAQPEKRPRSEGPGSVDRQRPADETRKKAPERRPRAESSVEQGAGQDSALQLVVPALWRPTLQLGPGRPVTVEDRLHGNPLAAAAFANACALPLDKQRLQGIDDATLLVNTLQSAFSVALDRVQHRDTRIELEAALKEKADLEASSQAEVDAAYRDGVEEATKDYDVQVDQLGPQLFELGCWAILKKMGIPEDDPIYQDLPKLKDQVTELSPAPSSCEAAPTPLPEAFPVEVPSEVVPTPSPEAPPAEVPSDAAARAGTI
ncbi:hypothetical protein CKAN_00633100 [Cinnamomum micranthum f. kanehirae]|uniref:Uncharacterized protein n=1 Tax=Cinnamomum micranthum f. kanehirae TaxID=337451 RepID=A0A3S3Q377_9MAGN|nr:hypothetical protein CKAN_00633100 [Cinnamomum micranthum f. kanehirae]